MSICETVLFTVALMMIAVNMIQNVVLTKVLKREQERTDVWKEMIEATNQIIEFHADSLSEWLDAISSEEMKDAVFTIEVDEKED